MSKRLIDDYLGDGHWRRTVRNWPNDIKAIVDGYRAYTGIAHAVQKDAIQNGWSARRNKRGDGWSFTFEVFESDDREFLSMTDRGTTGLTGRVLTPDEYELDLPAEERWGRFEGVAFTQPRSERTIGSRGRGKFIFVGASKEHTILYDTLRDDGTYRSGYRTVEKTESPVEAWDDNEGRQKLTQLTGGLIKPLSAVGTRVIIVNPVDELLDDIVNDRFARYIGETWWEIIQRYGAKIIIKAYDHEQIASIPREFVLKESDSSGFKVWLKQNQKAHSGIGTHYIKRLHVVHRKDNALPADIRGVAIQRGGMKICTIEAKYLPREIAERIYGFIRLDAKTEDVLLEDEGIEHYNFDFRKSLPGAIKRLVEDEITRFAQDKLGYRLDTGEVRRQQQRNAERRALIAINRFAREIGVGKGPSKSGGGSGGPRTHKEVYIDFDDVIFPRQGDLRVNFGESISNIGAKIINNSESEVSVRIRLFLWFYDMLVKTYFEGDFLVALGNSSEHIGPFQQVFLQDDFQNTGRYTVVAKIVSLRDEDKGDELDIENRSVYLEVDPPERGLFEKCDPIIYPAHAKTIMAESLTGERGGLVLQYNLNHPAQEAVQDQEDDLAAYLVWLMGHEMCRYDLLQENPLLFDQEEKENSDALLRKTLRKIGEFVHRFRMGEFD